MNLRLIVTLAIALFLAPVASILSQEKYPPRSVPPKINAERPTLRVNQVQATMKQIEVKVNELQGLTDQLEAETRSMSDLSEEQRLHLQQCMDRVNKFQAVLSNVMKKLSDTASTTVHNLR